MTISEDTSVTVNVLANDRDPDIDPLTVVSAIASVGSAVISGNQIQYTPPTNFNGTATITYRISDGQGGTATATLTVTVTPVNDAPTATPIAPRSVTDGAAVSVPVAGNFSDVDGNALSFSATGLPPGLSIDPVTGVISGTVSNAASQTNAGVYTATISVSDGNGGTVSQTISFTVSNPPPVATNDSVSTSEDTPVRIDVLANDSDPDRDPLTVITAGAGNGTVTINPDGSLRYVPNADFNGTDTITYTISDGQGGTSTATVTVTVATVNDPPVVSGSIGNQTNLDSQAISLPVGGAFADPEGDALAFTAVGLPAGLTINAATGVISGTIDHSASQSNGGVYSVTVTANDGKGGSVSQTFTWAVTNPAPVATDDSASVNEDTSVRIPVLANDPDADGDPLTVTAASAGNGTVTINADGSLLYTPNPNFNGSDTIIYRITDREGGFSTASVTVTVNPVNDAPVTSGIPPQNGDDGTNVSISIASSFGDPDGDKLTFTATNLPPTLTLDPVTGVISGALESGTAAKGPYVVTITATDPSGASVTTTFLYTVQNFPPSAVNDDVSTPEDVPVTIAVLTNDSDPNRDPLTITSASATNGTVVVNRDGTLTFTPTPDFNGTAVVSYTITDGNGGFSTATATITVGPVNDAPDAVTIPPLANQDSQSTSVNVGDFFSDRDGDTLVFSAAGLPSGIGIDPATGILSGTLAANASQGGAGGVYSVTVTATDPSGLTVSRTFSWTIVNPAPTATNDTATTAEDTAVAVVVLANDTDPDADPLTVTSATALHGTVSIGANGVLTYTPDANYNGTDTITYAISDGNGGSSTAAVAVTVTPVNDAPVAANDSTTTNEDVPVTFAVLPNDSDVDGDTLVVSAATSPNGTVTINADGTLTFTPAANFNGATTISYTISDGNGGRSTATVAVTVAAVNDAPVANPSTGTTAEDTPVDLPVLANDTDVDGNALTVTSASAANGTVVVLANGTVRYTPNANFNGTDTVTYTISDGQGGFSTSTVTVTVTPVNDAPTATPIAPQTGADGSTIRVPVAGSFTDVDGNTLSFSATGLPAGLSIDPATGVISGTIDRSASQVGGGTYSVVVTASDGNGGTVSTTFSWTVTNPAPTATNDSATTPEDTPVTVAVLANDSDPDRDPLTVVSATSPDGVATINPDGTITFTPAANFNGVATVTYSISDGQGGTSTATLRITVDPVNDAPVVKTPLANVTQADGSAFSLPVAGAFSDPDGNTLSFAAAGLPAGLAIDPATGVISGTIDRSASQVGGGVYTVTITASDGNGGTVATTFSFTVTNPAPSATNDSATTAEDTPVTITVLGNDRDPDADPLRITSATSPDGVVTINPDGTLSFVPAANFNGATTISYTISDGQGGVASATVAVTVTAVNDAPVVGTPLPNVDKADGAPVNLATAGSFSDVDGNTLTFSAGGLPAGLAIDPTSGVISGTLDRSASQLNGGVYSVTVTANDGAGGTTSSTFTFRASNPAPTAVNDSATTREDTPVTIAVLANDTDPDGDPLQISSAYSPDGTVVINADRTITFLPAANFNGTTTISYAISDGQGGTSTAIVTVTVSPVNDAPVVDTPLPNQSDLDGTLVSVATAGNFSDLDRDTLTFSAAGLPAGLTIDPATGVISGTLAANASQLGGGIYRVSVTANDGAGGSATSTFVWMIANPPPVAANDAITLNEDPATAVTIAVLANDSDPDRDALTVTSAIAQHGIVTINANGTLSYTPNPNYNGSDTITYSISDGQGGIATATVAVTVNPVNDAPVSAGLQGLFSVDSGSVSFPVGPAFSDLEGDPLVFSVSGLPAGLTIDPATGTISGTLAANASTGGPNANGVYTVFVTAADGNGGTVTSSFTWTVKNVAPQANNDAATTAEDTPVTLNVLFNDTDPNLDPLTPTLLSATHGTAAFNNDGTLTFTPDADFNGIATATYRVSDGKGGFSTAVATITVTPTNDAPNARPFPDRSNIDGASVSLATSGFFSDRDGDVLRYTAASLPDGLSIDSATGVISGTIDRSASQVAGGVYSVSVTATDPGGLAITQTFVWVVTNPAPTATNDTASTAEDTAVTVTVLTNDSDPDGDPLSVTQASAGNGTVTINPDGTLTYVPVANFNGTDTITYSISDGQGGTSTATVAVTITPVNDAPTAAALPARSNVDAAAVSVPVAVAFSDVDGNALNYTATGLPSGLSIDPNTGVIAGTIDKAASQGGVGGVYGVTVFARDGNGGTVSTSFDWVITNPAPVAANDTAATTEDVPVTISVLTNDRDPDGDSLSVVSARAANGAVTINIDGTLTYVPAANFNGSDTITYTISDGQGGLSTATVTITVAPANDAPTVAALAPQVNADGASVTLPTAASFSDVDGDTLTYSAANLPVGLTMDAATGVISGTIDRSASQGGTGGVYTVTVTASDGAGGTVSTSFNWTVTNPAPRAANDSASTTEDVPVTIAVLTNDSDPDGDRLSVATAAADNGTVVINPNGTLTYTPRADFNGTDTITYTISDGNGGFSTATVALTVVPANDPPVAVADTAATNEDTPVTLAVLLNDRDIDGNPLTVTTATSPDGSVVINSDGTITFTPNADFNGTATITYTISDGAGGTASATATVIVAPVNDPPVATNDTATTNEDTPVTVSVLTNDRDVDADTLTVTSASSPDGRVTLNANGTITFTPNADFNGVATVAYAISDGKGGTASATVAITVTPVNDPPVANPSSATTAEDTPVIVAVLANDSDVDGNPLTVTAASAANGTVTILPDGTVRYTPNPDFNGSDTITYTISDGQGGFATSSVAVSVTPVNDPPVATNDTATTAEDQPVTIPVLANDTDREGGQLIVTSASSPDGTVKINPDGTITFTPNANFNGATSITYTIRDDAGATSTATVAATVTPVNDAPIANPSSATAVEDTAVVVPVLANDSDPDGNPLTVVSATAPHGTVTINADGTVTYLPDADFNGTDTITYTISDGNGGVATSTVAITVAPVNDAPVAANDAATTQEDTPVTLAVLLNDSDVDGNPLTIIAATSAQGSTTINPDGTISFTPAANFTGVATLTYTNSDGSGGTATATATITVLPVNDPPIAAADQAVTNEDTPVVIAVLGNDRDVEGDPLSLVRATATNGTVTILPDGTVRYTPNPDFNGSDTITYTISDGQGGFATSTVDVTVTAVNDPPVAVADTATTNEDTPVTLAVLLNDRDIDGNPLTVTTGTSPDGSVVINSDGTITFTPNADFNGTATITYTISDGAGGTASATATVIVAPVNDPPVATNDTATTNEDTPVTVSVLANDRDVDGNPLTVTAAIAANGTVAILPDGTVRYTPNPDFNGSDTITYTISDGQGGFATSSVAVSVTPVNDPPVANPSSATTAEDTPVIVAVLANDSDVDGNPLTVTAATAANGTVAILPDGTVRYTPNPDFNGSDTIRYTISDGQGGFATSSVAVSVTPVNDPPVATNDTATTNEDTPVTVSVLANDRDVDADTLTVTSASSPDGRVTLNANGTITFTPNADFNGVATVAYAISDGKGGTASATVAITVTPVNDPPVANPSSATTAEDTPVIVAVLANDSDVDGNPLTVTAASAANGTVAILPDGTVRYTPNPDFNGSDTIRYTISDGQGGFATSSVAVSVTPVNDPPVATNDTATTNEDTPVTVSVLANDRDVDADRLTVTSASSPDGRVTLNANGTITFTPNADFNGVATVAYAISDGKGGTASATVAITVTPVNDPPVANPSSATTAEDTPVIVAVLANDSDVDGNPLTVTAASAANGTVAILPDGTVRYTPNPDFNGSDTITYTISDGQGGFATSSVAVSVTPVNDPPVATNDTATTNEDTPVTVSVLANDRDVDGDTLTVTSASSPDGRVTLNADGTITFTPNADFNGVATVAYAISDGKGGTASATVAITVTPVNDPPVANPSSATTAEDTPVIVAVLANDSDVDGNPLTVTAATAANGTVAILPDGTVRYTPNPDFNGSDTIRYTISDGQGGFATSSVAVSVTPVNDPPVANPSSATTAEDTPVIVAVLANDSDVDGNPLTVTAASAANGTVTILPDGTVRYTPNPNFNGSDTITYTISDGQGGFATSSVAVSVTPVNDPPIATNDTATTNEDTPVTVSVLANDRDVDGDTLTVTAASSPDGTVVINRDGTITFTPKADFNGTATIAYTISDGSGGTASATATVIVAPVNDPPVAVADRAATNEGVPVVINVLSNDRDVEGDRLSVVGATAPNGTVTILPDGTVRYTPNPGFFGTDTLTYTISDGKGGFATSTAAVVVTRVNTPPVDGDEAIDAIGGVIYSIPVLANASDANADSVSLFSATADVGTVTINPDGTLAYVAPIGFQGIATIRYVVSDGRGGFDVSVATVRVTQASADVNALLGLYPQPGIPDGVRMDGVRDQSRDFITIPLIIGDTVNAFRSLHGTPDLGGDRPLLTAVNGISWLGGMADRGHATMNAVNDTIRYLDRVQNLRDPVDQMFDPRWDDFAPKALTGFSVRHLATGNDQVMIESIVRDRVIYIEMRDVGPDNASRITEYRLRMRDGSRLPEWVTMDQRGLAIVERPANAEELHLVVRAIRGDGHTIDIPVIVQGATGEIQLDVPIADKQIGAAEPLSRTLLAARTASQREAATLADAFSDHAQGMTQ
ncbi:VCBS repeat-containing protein [Sphingomonas sp. UYEF23]